MAHHDETGCCGEGKLCSLTCCPCNLDIEKIKPLVNQPQYICKACGRVANDEESLCQPASIR
jgi:transposase-like protein